MGLDATDVERKGTFSMIAGTWSGIHRATLFVDALCVIPQTMWLLVAPIGSMNSFLGIKAKEINCRQGTNNSLLQQLHPSKGTGLRKYMGLSIITIWPIQPLSGTPLTMYSLFWSWSQLWLLILMWIHPSSL